VQRLKILAAFGVVYVVWGSTFAAIRIGVETVPPAVLSGGRFLVAGVLMLAFALARGERLPRAPGAWAKIALLGLSMIVCSNGVVTWAEQYVPSNQAALLVASSSLWMAWLGTLGPRGHSLAWRSKAGILVGFAGVALLFWPASGARADAPLAPFAQLAMLFAAFSWAAGSVFARNYPLELPTAMLSALQMLAGGLLMGALALATGEAHPISWTVPGALALGYLALLGSCLSYATYFWLIRTTTPDKLGTIAYVNPAVATLLGWWLLDESLSALQVAGMVVILAGVVLVVWQRPPRPER
jgi:drug/metabolite transporter (DMT)-like permease